MRLKVPSQFRGENDRETFDAIMSLEGEVYRAQPGRKTVRFVRDGEAYFIKQHFGVGWREIFKNLFQLRLPIIGASNEWRAILRLQALNVPTMELVGYGCRSWNPARQQSFVITRELTEVESLEDLCRDWHPTYRFKQALIKKVAEIARCLHAHGVNHRDFYLCHFLLDKNSSEQCPKLYLIDLHRVQIRRNVPIRWRVKDIAGLYFSAMDAGLTRRDIFRFISGYFNMPWREAVHRYQPFLKEVENRAVKLYIKDHQRMPKNYEKR